MTRPAEILARLDEVGLRLRLDGPDLVITPREALTPDLRDLLVEHKRAIINHLLAAPPVDGRLLDNCLRWIPPPERPGWCPCNEDRVWDQTAGLCRSCFAAVYGTKIQMPRWMIDAAGEEQ